MQTPSSPVTSTPAPSKNLPAGLTSAEVAERIQRGETNNYRARVGRSYWDIFRDNIFNLFNFIFGVLLVVVLLFQDYATVFFAGFSVVTNSLLGMVQEVFAKRRLDQLALLSLAKVRVYRDGELRILSTLEVVKDDVIPLEPGDRIVVDGHLLGSDALEVDESQLTGESDAVLKDEGDKVSSGSYCIAGSGVMVATAVGANSTINKLQDVAKEYKRVLTPTQRRIALIVQLSVVLMLVMTPMIFAAGFLTHGRVVELETFRSAVVFVASLVPQGLVLTATLALTIGAINISMRQTLVQRVNAVESMANVTTLCFDKTGTLTRNHLSVVEIIPLNDDAPATIDEKLRLYTGNLSNLNTTANAIADYLKTDEAASLVVKQREIPFTSTRKWGAVVFHDETLVLGAPERVLPPDARDALDRAQTLAADGLRVLALARIGTALVDGVLDDARQAVALIVLSDELRPEIHETLNAFTEQNVALKVITGDNLDTARHIATAAGMTITDAYTGDQIEAMNDAQLERAVANANLFARVEPETKRRIVKAIKARGEYVAMVGDGVNDVPALKEAHLAIAMNAGSQISKDIADIVLLNNAMTTLPLAFSEGRTITQSIFGTSKIFLVKNIYSLLFFLFAGFMLMPFPISPIQISWLTFGVINIPATLIAIRVIKPVIMKNFRRDVLDYVISAGFIGAVAMALVFGVTYLETKGNIDLARSTVMQFMTLFGVLTFWNIHGVDLYRPRSLLRHLPITLLGIALGIATVVVPYLLPRLIEYKFIAPIHWALVIAVFFAASMALHLAMISRGLVDRIWRLTAP